MKVSTTDSAMARARAIATIPEGAEVVGLYVDGDVTGAVVRWSNGLLSVVDEEGRWYQPDQGILHDRIRRSELGRRPKSVSEAGKEALRASLARARERRWPE